MEIKYEASPAKTSLQLIWTKLRNKVNDAARGLPPGAETPYVADDFGDVFGLLYFITGDGYSLAELKRYGKSLQRSLLQVEGVARVTLDGLQKEAIFVEISRQDAAALGAFHFQHLRHARATKRRRRIGGRQNRRPAHRDRSHRVD